MNAKDAALAQSDEVTEVEMKQCEAPRMCQAHFAMRELECPHGCMEFCIVADRDKINPLIQTLRAELAGAKAKISQYEFAAEGDEFDSQGVTAMSLGKHYTDALFELTRRKAYSKHSCAQMIAEAGERADKALGEIARLTEIAEGGKLCL